MLDFDLPKDDYAKWTPQLLAQFLELTNFATKLSLAETQLNELKALEKKTNKERARITELKKLVKEGPKKFEENKAAYDKHKLSVAESDNDFAYEVEITLEENFETYELEMKR